jgi:hypothetical protein
MTSEQKQDSNSMKTREGSIEKITTKRAQYYHLQLSYSGLCTVTHAIFDKRGRLIGIHFGGSKLDLWCSLKAIQHTCCTYLQYILYVMVARSYLMQRKGAASCKRATSKQGI